MALLYSLWYPEMREALEAKRKGHLADRAPEIDRVRTALRTRAIPLVILTATQVLVFAPDGIRVLVHGLSIAALDPSRAPELYDSVQAAFLAVCVALACLLVLAVSLANRLRTLLADLRRP